MTKRLQVYRCDMCANIVEVLHEGAGALFCCGQEMKRFEESTVDASREKHVLVIEKTAAGVKVRVGSVPHPMEEKHYIEWIELVADGVVCRRFLKPGDRPEAEFAVSGAQLSARALCNLHGLWKA